MAITYLKACGSVVEHLKRHRIVIACLGCLVACGFLACELFPTQVVDLYWGAKQWANAAARLEQLPPTHPAAPRPILPYADADGYAVCTAWINSYFRKGNWFLAIQQEAGASSPERPFEMPVSILPRRIQSEFGQAFLDYSNQNAERWLLGPFIEPTHARYTLVPASGLFQGWGDSGPNAPGDNRRPKYAVLSAVGFDTRRSRAVLFVAMHYGLDTNFSFFLFRKDSAVWRLGHRPIRIMFNS